MTESDPSQRRDSPRRFKPLRVLRLVGSVALTGVLLAAILPRIAGTPWAAIMAALRAPTWVQLAALTALWFTGLVVHSSLLMAALPGLSRRRALTLNLTGSAVSNVVPLGGGLGTWLNYVMTRRWGFSARDFSLFSGLSNAWNVLAKAALPVLAIAVLLATGTRLDGRLLVAAGTASVALVLVIMAAALVVSTQRGARLGARAADRALRLLRRGRPTGAPVEVRLLELRQSAGNLVRSAWRRMTVSMLGYSALHAMLLWACLWVVGDRLSPAQVLGVFAFERVLTALPITPGGSGVVEVAMTALLVAVGGSPASAAAGVLLFRAFTFGLEIPVGGAWLFGWWLTQRNRPRRPAEPGVLALGEAA